VTVASDDLAALAETLRAAIASLDERIEERARQIAAESSPATADDLLREALDRLAQVGEMWRRDMMERVPDGRDFLASIPAETWTASAAKLVERLCDEKWKRAKEEGERP
jgi:GTP1/Obg family GTP-binding protein